MRDYAGEVVIARACECAVAVVLARACDCAGAVVLARLRDCAIAVVLARVCDCAGEVVIACAPVWLCAHMRLHAAAPQSARVCDWLRAHNTCAYTHIYARASRRRASRSCTGRDAAAPQSAPWRGYSMRVETIE